MSLEGYSATGCHKATNKCTLKVNNTRAQPYLKWTTLATIDMGRKDRGGGCMLCHFRGNWDPTPSNTMWPESRYTSVPSGVFIHPAVWPINMNQKLGGGGCALFLWVAGSPSNTKSPGPRPASSGIIVHPGVWPQLQTLAENWGLCPFRGGERDPHLTQCRVGRRLATSLPTTK